MSRSFEHYLKLPQAYEDKAEEILVEFTVTSWGAPATGPSYASGGEPAEDPEIEIDKIYVDDREVSYYHPHPWFKLKAWLYRNLDKPFIPPVNPEWEALATEADRQIFEDFDFGDAAQPDPDYYRD